MESLHKEDVDNIPLLRKGAFVRVIRPGDPRMQTAQIMYPTPHTPCTLFPTPYTLHPSLHPTPSNTLLHPASS